jgi:LysM repeat protein
MSETNEKRDQAQILRERMTIIQQDDSSSVDSLSLPPRSKVHRIKDEKKKAKIKLKYPVVRLLTFLFVLLPVAILGYTFHQQNQSPVEHAFSQEPSPYREKISINSTKGKNDDPKIEEKIEKTEEEEMLGQAIIGNEEKEDTQSPESNDPKQEEDQEQASEKTSEYDIVFHTVKKGETLYSISQHYYRSRSGENLIKEWNHLKGNQVENGQVLKIPLMPSK